MVLQTEFDVDQVINSNLDYPKWVQQVVQTALEDLEADAILEYYYQVSDWATQKAQVAGIFDHPKLQAHFKAAILHASKSNVQPTAAAFAASFKLVAQQLLEKKLQAHGWSINFSVDTNTLNTLIRILK